MTERCLCGGVLFLVVVAGGVGGGTAAAAPSRECVEAYTRLQRGVRLRTLLQDEAALGEFRQANELCPSGRALAQMGLAEQALGQWLPAEAHLQQALDKAEPWIRQRRVVLQKALLAVRQHVGQLEVVLGQPIAEEVTLLVNGEDLGTLPLAAPLHLVAGKVTLTVTALRHTPVVRETVITAGELARETVELVRLPPPPRPAPREEKPAVAEEPARPVPPEAVAVAPAAVSDTPVEGNKGGHGQGKRQLLRRLGIVGLVVGVAGLGAGVAGHVLREQGARAWNADPVCVNADLEALPAQCAERLRRVTTGQALAVGGYVAGGVVAAAGIVLLALPARVTERMDRALRGRVGVVAGAQAWGAVWSGTF